MAGTEVGYDPNEGQNYRRTTVDDADVARAQAAQKFSGPVVKGGTASSDPEPRAEDFGGDIVKWSAARKAWKNRQAAKVQGQKQALGGM